MFKIGAHLRKSSQN